MKKYLVAIGLLLASTGLAIGQELCANRDRVAQMLFEDFGEQMVMSGLVGGEGQFTMELYLSEDLETWTVLYVDPADVACMVGNGGDVIFPLVGPFGEDM